VSELVSVIMPVWRPRADWLRAAVTSALDEDGCEIDLVLVDDGNDEPLAPLLADVGDPRLRIVRIDHAGPYSARNAGLAEARGAFVRFFDADDVVEPGSTGRLLARAADGGEAIAYGATLMCDDDLVPQATHTSEVEGDAVADCVMGRFTVFVVSLLFPRAAIERAGPWEPAFAVSGDWDFVLRTLDQAPVRRVDEVVTRYRRHHASVTKRADVAAGAAAGELVLERYFTRHPELRGSELERAAYARLHLDRARAHAARGERRHAAGQLAKAARRDPAAGLSAGAEMAGAVIARAARRAGRALGRRA
jgi:glycosyltransferase involved in cell wall biosynthesis